MGAGVTWSAVRFGFDDAAADKTTSCPMDEIASEQLTGDNSNRSLVERAWERCVKGKGLHGH